MRDDIPMPDCIRYLARMQRKHPQRERITVLIGQCRNYGKYPGVGARILETIEQIEERSKLSAP